MKNTVYALARHDPIDHVEAFALRLTEHFIVRPSVARVIIRVVEHPWSRLEGSGGPHPHAFVHTGAGDWTATVTRDASGASVVSGVTNLAVMKKAASAFYGFPREEHTTVPETTARL